ncbi:hypothetical protein FRC02_003700 [Tulasnella sp. 418]|nr:hypothetical protein FRC02_003700 [Tulasnella sp. 418]
MSHQLPNYINSSSFYWRRLLLDFSLHLLTTSIMPRPFYKGIQKKRQQKKRAKLPLDVRRERREKRRQQDAKLCQAIQGLTDTIESNIASIAEEHNRSEDFIRLALGTSGPEVRQSRAVQAYNAWVKFRMEELNDGVPLGDKLNVASFKEQYGHEYSELSGEEKETYMEKLIEWRKMQHPTTLKYHKEAEADIQASMKELLSLADRLEQRTGYCVTIWGHKGSDESNAQPICRVPQKLEIFTNVILKLDPASLLFKMEAWAINGSQGVVRASQLNHDAKKHDVVELLRKSFHSAAEISTGRLSYSKYVEKIVLRHHVDIVGWPLKEFVDPSRMKMHELQSVYDGLTASPPTIYFKKLSETEVEDRCRLHRENEAVADASEGNGTQSDTEDGTQAVEPTAQSGTGDHSQEVSGGTSTVNVEQVGTAKKRKKGAEGGGAKKKKVRTSKSVGSTYSTRNECYGRA